VISLSELAVESAGSPESAKPPLSRPAGKRGSVPAPAPASQPARPTEPLGNPYK
jgi:hypothetical protein